MGKSVCHAANVRMNTCNSSFACHKLLPKIHLSTINFKISKVSLIRRNMKDTVRQFLGDVITMFTICQKVI